MGQSTEFKVEEVHETLLRMIAEGVPAPQAHPNQWLADLGYRHLVVVSTLETRSALAFFDILGKVGEADEEMERYAQTGKYTDRFGVALAIEARK